MVTGESPRLTAEWLTRAQCRSRSGVTPSKARPPSKTVDPSQAPCVRGPMIGTLPSCQLPSKNVHVRDGAISAMVDPLVETALADRAAAAISDPPPPTDGIDATAVPSPSA